MPLPTSSLANICNLVREHVDTLGQTPSPADWDVRVTIGAPGANLAAVNNLATTYARLGRLDEARDLWRRSLAIDPNQTRIRAYLESAPAR